ncbi:DNA repair protein, partial [Vibrio sp.]|uniref:DNA repair protein n=1 Tax=Vibrio sp. TaxID=678 RepID=UPI003D0F0743
VLGYNIMLQYKVKVEATKKQESARYLAIIDATEELIGNAHHVPFSKELLLCLNNRILDALQNMFDLDPKNKQLAQRIENMKGQIQQVQENYTGSESNTFKSPSTDKQALLMLKLVKRLRDTIRSEHNKGRFETQYYVVENARLETIQIRINIENVIKRANDAIVRGQPGTAVQLLKKGIDALSSKTDPYSLKASEKLNAMYDELEQRRQNQNAQDLQDLEDRERDDDMNALFGEKKKW